MAIVFTVKLNQQDVRDLFWTNRSTYNPQGPSTRCKPVLKAKSGHNYQKGWNKHFVGNPNLEIRIWQKKRPNYDTFEITENA